MSYQVLARKWRPKRFADLVGQEHVVRALSNALTSERLHHAYLLTGTRGVGKTTIARILAKSLNCETGITAEPCGVCAACRQIDAGRYVDLLEIDAASNTGIDNIREVLENAQYAPTLGRFKVYIIDEVHMLSKSAFNAMLKTLEEPPAHVKFILATTDPQKVPVTVLSRCLQFSLRNMTPQQIAGYLAHVLEVEGVAYETPALSLLGRGASGSMRDALSLLDQAIAYGVGEVKEEGVRAMLGAVDRSYLFGLLGALADADGPLLIREADQLAERGIGFDSALTEMTVLLQQIAMAQTIPQAVSADEPEYDAIFALAQQMTPEDVQLYYQIAVHGRRDLALAPDEHAGFNMALIRMLAFHPANQTEPAPVATRTQAPLATHTAPAGRGAMDQARAMLTRQAGLGRAPAAAPQASPSSAAGEDVPPSEPEPEPAARPLSVALISAPRRDEDGADDDRAGDVLPPDDMDNGSQADDESYVPLDEVAPAPLTFDGNWLALVSEIGPRMGTVRMLAQNAVLKSWQAGEMVLAVPESFRHLASRDYQEKLRAVLAEHFGHALDLKVVIEESSTETPAMRDARNRHELRLEARAVLENDPVVQQLVREFDATLLTDTIQPAQE